jgi:hypothetical protein
MILVIAAASFGIELVLQPGSEGKDNQIIDTQPTTNRGTYSYLTTNWSGGCEDRGLIEFEGLSVIPSGAVINSANLELYTYTNNPNDTFGIYRITESWTESGSTWTNQPAHHATAYALTLVTGAATYSFDVKNLVQEWADGTYVNYGMMLKRPSGNRTGWPYFASSDHTSYPHPKLTVDYGETGVTPMSMGKVKALFN